MYYKLDLHSRVRDVYANFKKTNMNKGYGEMEIIIHKYLHT